MEIPFPLGMVREERHLRDSQDSGEEEEARGGMIGRPVCG